MRNACPRIAGSNDEFQRRAGESKRPGGGRRAQGIIAGNEEQYVAKVLNAAALTYVAATLQGVMTLAYYLLMLFGGGGDD